MSYYIQKNNIVNNHSSVDNHIKKIISEQVIYDFSSAVVFDRMLFARGLQTDFAAFNGLDVIDGTVTVTTWQTSAMCICGRVTYQQTPVTNVYHVSDVQINPPAPKIYSIDLPGLYEEAEPTLTGTISGIISSNYTANSLDFINKLLEFRNLLSSIHKYKYNIYYIGQDTSVTPPASLNYINENALTGLGQRSSKNILTCNEVGESFHYSSDIYLSATPVFGITDQTNNFDLESEVYGSGMVNEYSASYISWKLVLKKKAQILSHINEYSFSDIIFNNKIITEEDTINCLQRVLDDWKENLDRNADEVNIYICHYNCHSDASLLEQEQVQIDDNCDGIMTEVWTAVCNQFSRMRETTSDWSDTHMIRYRGRWSLTNNEHNTLKVDVDYHTYCSFPIQLTYGSAKTLDGITYRNQMNLTISLTYSIGSERASKFKKGTAKPGYLANFLCDPNLRLSYSQMKETQSLIVSVFSDLTTHQPSTFNRTYTNGEQPKSGSSVSVEAETFNWQGDTGDEYIVVEGNLGDYYDDGRPKLYKYPSATFQLLLSYCELYNASHNGQAIDISNPKNAMVTLGAGELIQRPPPPVA